MTREEAIRIQKWLYNNTFLFTSTENDVKQSTEMAIKALEQEQKYCDRNICLRNEYNGIGCDECEVTKSQESCKDAISREAVLDAISRIGLCKSSANEVQAVKECLIATETLPPVTPQAKTVLYSGDGYADGYMVYDMAECPNCGYEYEDGDKDWGLPFCPNCGQSLDWESEDKE